MTAVAMLAAAVAAFFVPLSPHRSPVAAALIRRTPYPSASFELDFPADDDDDDEDSLLSDSLEDIRVTERPAGNMTSDELQSELRHLGQKHTGTKAELIKRVQTMQRKQALGLPIHDMQVQMQEELRWYMLQTANGFEGAVARNLNMIVKAQRLESKIASVFVPLMEGESSVRESSVMPSYIFVQMRMDAALHFLISDMQYVINFVGADRGARSATGQMVGSRGFVRPMPMTDDAFEKIVQLTKQKVQQKGSEEEGDAEEAASAEPAPPPFDVEDLVEVTEGPFRSMQGPVLELVEGGREVTLVLTVMGRDTPVTLPIAQCVPVA